MANGTANPLKWDYSSGKTWGYMAGGAVTGSLAGGAANAVATSGIPLANTAETMTGSIINSVGTHMYTGGQTDISVGFGVASYNLSKNEWGYLGKKGDSGWENFGYFLGGMANLADVNQLVNSANATLYTEANDAISHSAIVDDQGNILMSYGPNDSKIGGNGFKDRFPAKKPVLRGAGGYKKFGKGNVCNLHNSVYSISYLKLISEIHKHLNAKSIYV